MALTELEELPVEQRRLQVYRILRPRTESMEAAPGRVAVPLLEPAPRVEREVGQQELAAA